METQTTETTRTKATKWVRIPPTRTVPGRIVEIDAETLELLGGGITFHGPFEIKMSLQFLEVSADVAAQLAKQPLYATGTGRPISPENPSLFEIVESEEEARAIVERDANNIRRTATNGVARFGRMDRP